MSSSRTLNLIRSRNLIINNCNSLKRLTAIAYTLCQVQLLMSEFHLDSDDIRYLLQNAGKIKKEGRCIECGGIGWQNWDENGEDIKNGKSSSIDRDYG